MATVSTLSPSERDAHFLRRSFEVARRNPTESDKNIRTTNIARVDDMRHPGKPLLSLGPQEPVGVRDDSNPQHCSIHRCAPNSMSD